jgi:hypothetical protein
MQSLGLGSVSLGSFGLLVMFCMRVEAAHCMGLVSSTLQPLSRVNRYLAFPRRLAVILSHALSRVTFGEAVCILVVAAVGLERIVCC